MKIWEVNTDKNNIQISLSEKEFRKLDPILWEGKRLNDIWDDSIKFYIESESDIASNFPYCSPMYFIADEKAENLLKQLVDEHIEILPMNCKGKHYKVINIVNVVDCLDVERSRYQVCKGDPSQILKYEKLEFLSEKIEEYSIFMIPQYLGCAFFCTDKFKYAMEEAGIKGLCFNLIDDTDIREESPLIVKKQAERKNKQKNSNESAYIAKYSYFISKSIESEIMYDGDEGLIEEFFDFIETLEKDDELTIEEKKMLSICYSFIGYYKKAADLYESVYDKNNKKEIKLLYRYRDTCERHCIRPSKRKINIPKFKYLSDDIAKKMFFVDRNMKCKLCGKKGGPFYMGSGFNGDGECVSFQNLDEKYCAKCMKSGKIHKECNISFNDPFMNFDGKVTDKAWDEFIYKTPRYELASWEYDIKGWPSCCDDFMKCLGDDNGEYKFVCNHCSKEITMELD